MFAYSFIVTSLDVSTGVKPAQVEHWYRHRTQVENLFLLRGFWTPSHDVARTG